VGGDGPGCRAVSEHINIDAQGHGQEVQPVTNIPVARTGLSLGRRCSSDRRRYPGCTAGRLGGGKGGGLVVVITGKQSGCFILSSYLFQVRLDESFPRRLLSTLWRRHDAVSLQYPLDCVPADVVAQMPQGSSQARVGPGWIVARHRQQKPHHLAFRPQPPGPPLPGAVVFCGHQLPIPAQNGLREQQEQKGQGGTRSANSSHAPKLRLANPSTHQLSFEITGPNSARHPRSPCEIRRQDVWDHDIYAPRQPHGDNNYSKHRKCSANAFCAPR